jgi:CubicO group peptidase (beta-lactamase class C family)
MAFSRLILTAALAVCWAGVAVAEEPAAVANPQQLGFAPERLHRLGEVYKGYVDRGELPGAVLLVARADKIAYFQAVGFQDREKKTAMKTDAIFRLASMTKPIVSVAAMMLVEEGKLDLMAPVSKYLPEFKDLKVGVEKNDPATGKPVLLTEPQHRPMIVQDLLRHTAGLVYGQFGDHLIHQMYRDAKIGDRGDTLAEMVTKMSKVPLAHQPGEVWEYSMAVDVLGRVIEVVSGKELDAFIAERVAKPLGMTATDFYVHEPDLPRLAEAQAPPADSKSRMPPDVTKKPHLFSGGGGLVASAAQWRRVSRNPPAGAAYRRADDLGCTAAGGRVLGAGADLDRRHRADPGDGPRFRPRLCRAHRGRAQPAARLGRQLLLDRRLGHDVLGRSGGTADRDPDDPDPVGSGRPLPPRLPRAYLCGADRNRAGALNMMERIWWR